MTSAHQLLAGLSGWLWPALLDHLWQGTLFAGVAWLFCLLAKRASSKTRYAVWLMASLKFAVPTSFLCLAARSTRHSGSLAQGGRLFFVSPRCGASFR